MGVIERNLLAFQVIPDFDKLLLRFVQTQLELLKFLLLRFYLFTRLGDRTVSGFSGTGICCDSLSKLFDDGDLMFLLFFVFDDEFFLLFQFLGCLLGSCLDFLRNVSKRL